MFKIIGSVLIVLSCTAFGVEKSRELSIHRKELEELQRLFVFIQKKLEYIKIPFEELFATMESEWLLSVSKELKSFSKKTFYEVWTSSIDRYFQKTFLTK